MTNTDIARIALEQSARDAQFVHSMNRRGDSHETHTHNTRSFPVS